MGASAVAQLHADPAFRQELEAAKAEYAHISAKGLKPTRDCLAETDALVSFSQPLNGEAEILQAWHDDYPVNKCIGDWVLVHVGFAMNRIDEDEAQKTLEILAELGEVQEELEAMRQSATTA